MRTDVRVKSNRNLVCSCQYHVVWGPKYRRPVWVDSVDDRLKEILQQRVAELQAEVIEWEVMPDQVHLFCEMDPQFGLHRFTCTSASAACDELSRARRRKWLKGRSSRLLQQAFLCLKSCLPTLGTDSYFVATVGGVPLAVVKQYIEDQKGG